MLKKEITIGEVFNILEAFREFKGKNYRVNKKIITLVRELEVHRVDTLKAIEGLTEEEVDKAVLEKVSVNFPQFKESELPQDVSVELSMVYMDHLIKEEETKVEC